MNQHEVADREVIPAQFICFIVAGLTGILGNAFLSRTATPIASKIADAIFITGCILVAMKLARKGWDLPASGYTVLSIAWGVFFLAKDFSSQEVGKDIFTSAFYFLLPSLMLIAFYRPFPTWIKALTLVAMLPSLIGLIIVKSQTLLDYESLARKTNYMLIHVTGIVWGSYFYWMYRRNSAGR
jgi:hypothetical protein